MPSSPTHERVRRLFARRRRRNRTRDWSELPLDVICSIFHKLDQTEILMGAGQVCRSWRSAARDEPHLWRRIHMPLHSEAYLLGMAREAVLRSKGLCEAFFGECAADDDFLLYLGTQAPSLKSLRLIKCYDVSTKGFIKAIKKFPQLEELELDLCTDVYGMRVFNTVGRACQQLKRLKLTHHNFYNLRGRGFRKDAEALGIATMTELRSLEMFGNNVTNKGLIAILDSCPHLESLDIRRCFNVNIDDDALREKCALITTLKLPKD
uniref:Uncharacterized protein n=1 Tax=Avena sativa TaxID=4498 RepID=A0ACD5XEH4_AVESA